MDSETQTLVGAWVGFSMLPCLTLFFSFHPKLYIRVFVPRDEWRDGIRAFLRDPHFPRGMRVMAALQFGLGQLIGIAAILRLIFG